MKTNLLNENPNHKCGQTNDRLFIERKQCFHLQVMQLLFCCNLQPEIMSVHGCPRAFSRQCAKINPLK